MTEDFAALLGHELQNFDPQDGLTDYRDQTQETRLDLLAVARWLLGRQDETDDLVKMYLDDDPVVILAVAAGKFTSDERGVHILAPAEVPERLRRLRRILVPTRVISLLAVAMVTVEFIDS